LEKDYLIIGQGIAGSLLGFELTKLGATLDIVNKTDQSSSSHVAAGLYNPVTGRKMVKTWNADKVFHNLEHYYSELEGFLLKKFLYPTGIYRPFVSQEEQNDWQGRVADGNFHLFIEELKSSFSENLAVNDPHGGLLLKQAGYVDVPTLLEGFKTFFEGRDSYIEDVIDLTALDVGDGVVKWEKNSYKQVICCEGTGVRNNPYFNWLPLSPVKGEILDVTIEYTDQFVLNRGVFLLPKSQGGISRLGSTYDNHNLDYKPTNEAVNYLKDKLKQIYKSDFEIVNHKAGIRPATKDRKPFVGRHPAIKELSIFNGFGTKGVSLAVYYARQFADYLINHKSIDPEVNIDRYFSFYSNQNI